MIGNPVAYRDRRRVMAVDEFLSKISRQKLYELTASQTSFVNTIFELYALAKEKSPQLGIARDLLFIPDIFNYFLTGQKSTEFTFATTSQLYNIRTDSWEKEIFTQLGVSYDIMQKIIRHGTIIGTVDSEICKETGLNEIPVIAVGSHDTASAVAACPLRVERRLEPIAVHAGAVRLKFGLVPVLLECRGDPGHDARVVHGSGPDVPLEPVGESCPREVRGADVRGRQTVAMEEPSLGMEPSRPHVV